MSSTLLDVPAGDARRRGQHHAVPTVWPGETVVCLGGGPSLTQADVDLCRGQARVIAINDAYRMAPWAEVLYGCDARWWNWHDGVTDFPGRRYALTEGAQRWGVTVLRNTGERGLERDPTGLRTGRNSGYQAINLAVHLGAKRIVLLGYDMGYHGSSHWFGEHPNRVKPNVNLFRGCFEWLVRPLHRLEINVINASRETTLATFPRASLLEALA